MNVRRFLMVICSSPLSTVNKFVISKKKTVLFLSSMHLQFNADPVKKYD